MASIFVQIPSYHDQELLPTLQNIIETSSGNNIVNFGIHNGFYKNPIFDEKELKSVSTKSNISVLSSAFPENIGVGISRFLANSFYDGEDFYLQTDSHMRFAPGWDDCIISNYEHISYEYGIEKLILSCYPSRYNYFKENNNQIEHYDGTYRDHLTPPTRMVLHEHSEVAMFLNEHLKMNVPLQKIKYVFSNIYMSGALAFSVGEYSLIKPNIQIIGQYEEMLTAFRAYSHGFDVHPPQFNIAYHLWRSRTVNETSTIEENDEAVFYNKRRFPDYDCLINNFNLGIVKNLEEIKDIIINNRIDDQAFGVERDFQDLMRKIY
jgi:hypothetical protein